jgi:aryl-alcohol dehydrogenase-like predicted oxidoreductase
MTKPRIATRYTSQGGTVMQYCTLGRTGVQVSSLVLGAMNFGEIGRTTQEEATAIVDAALEAGINLIDTADMYSQGESEEMVGKAIVGRRDDIVLAAKAGLPNVAQWVTDELITRSA